VGANSPKNPLNKGEKEKGEESTTSIMEFAGANLPKVVNGEQIIAGKIVICN
jgi:hypothetical protein